MNNTMTYTRDVLPFIDDITNEPLLIECGQVFRVMVPSDHGSLARDGWYKCDNLLS